MTKAIDGNTTSSQAANIDAEIIGLATRIEALNAEADRFMPEWESQSPFRAKEQFLEEHVRPLVDEGHSLRAALAKTRASTIEGLRAKARIVQLYTTEDDGDGVAWSLAKDLLEEQTTSEAVGSTITPVSATDEIEPTIAQIAAIGFGASREPGTTLTRETWIDQCSTDWPTFRLGIAVLERNCDELVAILGQGEAEHHMAFFESVNEMKGRYKSTAEMLETIEARIIVAMARLAESSDPASTPPTPSP